MSDRSKEVITKMDEALRLMDASVNDLRSVVLALRSDQVKIEIVDGENDDER